MSWELLDIDHLIIRAASLNDAVNTYRALGFTVAPERKRPTDPVDDVGPARRAPFNARQILFQPYPGRDDVANFIVLQSIEEQLSVPVEIAQIMSFMLDSEGPRAIICYSIDLERTREAMTAAGVEIAPPRWIVEDGWRDEERGVDLPVRSQPCITLTRRTPFVVNGFNTTTLETYRHQPWTVHPNTARYMAGVTGVTDDIAGHAEWMAHRVFDTEPVWESDDVAIIRPRDLFLRIVTPRGFAELYPGLDFSSERILPALAGVSIAVGSMDKLREVLGANGIEHVATPRGALVIPRHMATNTVVEFVPSEAAP